MTRRQEKVGSLIQREISQSLLDERPEGISGILTIKGVEVTANLEHAKIFFSIVGQGGEEAVNTLKKHIYKLQGVLIRKLRMKKVPRIVFVHDQSGEYAQHIGALIRKTHLPR